jgi:DNA gyrase subunit A
MSLAKGARVIAAGTIGHRDSGSLLVVSNTGHGKRTPLTEFPVKGRATGGVQATVAGFTIGATAIMPDDADALLRTKSGQSVRLAAREVPRLGRASRGSVLVKLEDGDQIDGLAIFPPEA